MTVIEKGRERKKRVERASFGMQLMKTACMNRDKPGSRALLKSTRRYHRKSVISEDDNNNYIFGKIFPLTFRCQFKYHDIYENKPIQMTYTTFNCSTALALTKLLEKNYSNPQCYGMACTSPMRIILCKRNFPAVASQF